MKKKILSGHNFHREPFQVLNEQFDLTYPPSGYFKKDQIHDIIGEYEVFIPNFSFYTDKEIIDKAKNLKLIANFGVGYNNIDVEYAAQKGIVVTNTPNSVLEPTAELCFGLIHAVARRIGFYNNKLRTPEGVSWGLYDNPGIAIYGKTLGIYGFGRIGQAIARRAIACGMNIIYHNRRPVTKEMEEKYNARYVSFDELLSQSDFISINAPATPETYHIINEAAIDKMKSNAVLINTSRGSTVDEVALIEALKNNRIFGAGLDVYETEPRINPEFFKLDNVVLTPHAGTQTIEGRYDMQREVAENIINFYAGKPISKVN
ncbi:NAD(P)-binding domain-containing protein [Dysgonomonas sp. HDW5B]|uniref:NAD(P)-dependent oxidoreductase n=1 Tax=Dysgonomonas sp. HDW5B TaxID=2714927 RepID=UPI00140AD1FC|nr:NAD(P)-dependent oxidoreductase [Dysgonomonas sp. HDW5B]QIK53963.1 NAD(P)-binding domain-containing protein [Dysgonomonas sp. HDW5B]